MSSSCQLQAIGAVLVLIRRIWKTFHMPTLRTTWKANECGSKSKPWRGASCSKCADVSWIGQFVTKTWYVPGHLDTQASRYKQWHPTKLLNWTRLLGLASTSDLDHVRANFGIRQRRRTHMKYVYWRAFVHNLPSSHVFGDWSLESFVSRIWSLSDCFCRIL